MHQELLALEARKAQLARCLQETGPKLVRMSPRLADLYREKVAHLHAELNRDPIRSEAASVLRGLISEIRLVPEAGELEIELVGEVTSILALASERPRRADAAG